MTSFEESNQWQYNLRETADSDRPRLLQTAWQRIEKEDGADMCDHSEYEFARLNRTFRELSQAKESDDSERHPLFRQGKKLA